LIPGKGRNGRLKGLPLICSAQTRILILGSFPSEASLASGQSYGHPRNQFWRLLGACLGEPLQDLEYRERLARVLAGGVGIWDVIASCQRRGSLDSAIRDEIANDFVALFQRWPAIECVAFNGSKAARYRRTIQGFGKRVAVLPSSSPANATHSFADKLLQWEAVINRGGP